MNEWLELNYCVFSTVIAHESLLHLIHLFIFLVQDLFHLRRAPFQRLNYCSFLAAAQHTLKILPEIT